MAPTNSTSFPRKSYLFLQLSQQNILLFSFPFLLIFLTLKLKLISHMHSMSP